MSYTTYDFSESLNRVGIVPESIELVLAAWGAGDGQGTDSGIGWSEHGVTDWGGGFLFKLKNGMFAYVSGWCDYTGWGCQDGAKVQYFQTMPCPDALKGTEDYMTQPNNWDEEPADLNRWLAKGGKGEDL